MCIYGETNISYRTQSAICWRISKTWKLSSLLDNGMDGRTKYPMLDVSTRLAALDDIAAYCEFMAAIFAEHLDTLILDVSPDLKAASRYVTLHDGLRSALLLAESAGKLV